MRPVLLTDFGSTYTKLTAVDLDAEAILGTAAAYTTVQTDINEGFEKAMAELKQQCGSLTFSEAYACSSAAGGLRMVVSGLVPELTMEAAKMACLGAGAKVVGQYSFQMTEDDVDEIRETAPDIFLLVGGTDGGNRDCIVHNAKMLASMHPAFPVIIAGNRNAAKECGRILEGCDYCICPNVMPKFGVLKIEETQARIREIFLHRIIQAKGIAKASSLFSDVLMPTPAAVLRAVTLFSEGCEDETGVGELIAVDVGGATTDVYSVAEGMPKQMNRVFKGLPEPYSKRTVEGDIGMRYSIRGIAEEAGIDRLAALSGLSQGRVEELLNELSVHTDTVPNGDAELEAMDIALASMAVETAVARHAGTMEETYTMLGLTYVQSGKDLTDVKRMVVTGGSLIHSADPVRIAGFAQASPQDPGSLRPKKAEIFLDKRYILAAMGLLAEHHPLTALHIMKKEIPSYGYSE